MSWAFPVEKIASGYVLDMDDFNANMAAWAAETDGNLNEHNFQAAATLVNLMDQAADNIAIRVLHHQEIESPTGSGGFDIPHQVNWSPVEDMDVTFASPGGDVLVFWSFQMNNPTGGGGDHESGVVFCLELDGAPMMNSLLGSGDGSNDYSRAVGGDYDFDTSPSFRSAAHAYEVVGEFRLTPGLHRIRGLARNLFTIESAAPTQTITQRELIILHLWT